MTTNMQLPKVNYLILSKDRKDTHRAIVHALYQDYPNHLKTCYVVHQTPQDALINCDIYMKVHQIHVEGIEGHNWWMKKLLAYCNVVRDTDTITLMFDEDDIYHPGYTQDVVTRIRNFDGMWNYKMLFCDKSGIHYDNWSSAISTMALHTPIMMKAVVDVVQAHPALTAYKGKAPLDSVFRLHLDSNFKMGIHEGDKAYIFSLASNTSNINATMRKLSIDYIEGE